MFQKIYFVAILILYTVLLIPSTMLISVASTDNSTIGIFPPTSKPYGLSYEEHIKNFYKWIISLPIDKNPWEDATGSNCHTGQSESNSSIFYLSSNGGGKSDRTCIIESGKGLFIPISAVFVSDKEVPNSSIENLHSIAKKDQDSVTSLYLSINKQEYNRADLEPYRIHTTVFDAYFPENAIAGASEGNSKVVADGYYLITKPLEKGNYTIHYKSSLICTEIDCLEPNFAQDIKYTIIAK
jgi:hypothetical protein